MISQSLSINQKLSGFTVKRIESIPELRSEAAIFVHDVTRAQVVHLFNDDPNNLFAVAFRTPVSNSTGVPHILEHSVLCGSHAFPLKDPFLELLKGSLQTFLNAFTYPDKTVYPVSSQVPQDFYNLVHVYCDAVFAPLLTKNAFAQEGWHFDLAEPGSEIDIKGIVYNEMKGVFSDFSSHVGRRTLGALFPDTSYFHESGGDPESIVQLTYEEFCNFHKTFYHPSNAFIFLYGNLPAEKTLNFLQEKYLHAFQFLQVDSTVAVQPPWSYRRFNIIDAPAPKEDDGTASVILSWIFGDTTDPQTVLLSAIMSRYLLETESSPLRRALIDSGLGQDLDDMTGAETDLRQVLFAVGLRKTNPQNSDKIKNLVFDTLRREVELGINQDLLEGCIRQVEFRLREIVNSGLPYNIRLAERCFRSWLYGGDPLAHLAFEKTLTFIKEQKSADPEFFSRMLSKLLVSNMHCLVNTVRASSKKAEDFAGVTKRQVAALTASFTDKQRKETLALTKKLVKEQSAAPTAQALSTLPRLPMSALPLKNQTTPALLLDLPHVKAFCHPLFTSNVVYVDVGFDCSSISLDLLPYLPLYTDLICKAGAAGIGFEAMSTRKSLSTGGIGSSLLIERPVGSEAPRFLCLFHGKALKERTVEMTDILRDLFTQPDLGNGKQVKDLVFEMRNSLYASVISNGNSFASRLAASRLSLTSFYDEQLSGIAQLRFLDRLSKESKVDNTLSRLQELHSIVVNRNNALVSLTADDPTLHKTALSDLCSAIPELTVAPAAMEFNQIYDDLIRGVEISAAVNFAAHTWLFKCDDPATIGELSLLARTMSTGYLWNKIRVEGGAYGARAAYSAADSIFSCSSYRDPNLMATFDHFTMALKMIEQGIERSEVDQSIIGAIGKIDTPRSPHERGLSEALGLTSGRSIEFRQAIRDSILGATPKTLSRCARTILDLKTSARSVLGGSTGFDNAQKKGATLLRETLLPS